MAEKKTTRKGTKSTGPAGKKADCEAAVLAKIVAMPAPYSALGERLHALILCSAPALHPNLWYGMPAYAKDGEMICVFRAEEYMTLGLSG